METSDEQWCKCLGHDHEDWRWEYAKAGTAGYFKTHSEARNAWILGPGKDSELSYFNDPRDKQEANGVADHNQRDKINDFRKIMFKTSPELGDGVSECTYQTVDQLCEMIRDFAQHYSSPSDAGESFTVELVALTDAEFDQLPQL